MGESAVLGVTAVSAPARRSVLEGDPAAVPDGQLSVEQLGSRIVAGAGRLAAATCRWLQLVAAFDDQRGFEAFGLWSTARWLSHHCGLSARTSVEHVRVARALASWPRLAAEMSGGRLSYSQVRAISRVLRDGDGDLLDALITSAEHGSVGQLESLVRGLRNVDQLTAGPGEPADYLTRGWNAEGRWRLAARLAPEDGAIVDAALAAAAGYHDDDETLTAAAALVRLAEIAFAAMNDSARPPRLLRGDERAAVVIHLDADALGADGPDDVAPVAPVALRTARAEAPDHRPPEPRSRERTPTPASPVPGPRIANGPPLPRHVVERLLCHGRIRSVLTERHGTGPVQILDVGRSHRVVTDRQYRALMLRDHGECAYPGCRSRRGLDAHHVHHWIDGGETALPNMVLLCGAHHTAHHAGAFTITALPHQQFRFVRTDGGEVPGASNPSALITTSVPLEDEFADIAATAARTRWTGQRLDRGYAVSALAQLRRPAP